MFKLFLAAVLAAGIPILSVQAKTDFSGTWKLNDKISDPGPRSVVFKIEHKDPTFKYSASGETAEGQHFSEDAELTTDGRVHPGPNSGTVSGNWEGETLVLLYKIGDNQIKMTLKLSTDGKQMFRDVLDRHEVYDKQ